MNKKLDALLDTLVKLQLEDCLPVQLEDVKNPKENVTLFDLINDPDEKNNIANSNPDIVKNMEKILVGFTNNTLSESTKKLSRDEKRRSIKNRMRLDVISYEPDSIE